MQKHLILILIRLIFLFDGSAEGLIRAIEDSKVMDDCGGQTMSYIRYVSVISGALVHNHTQPNTT